MSLIPLSLVDGIRVAVTRRLCRCDEIECLRCTKPLRPRSEQTRAELIDELEEWDAWGEDMRARLDEARARLRLAEQKLDGIAIVVQPGVSAVHVAVSTRQSAEGPAR